MGPTEKLAQFVVATHSADMPREVLERGKLALLDTFGVLLAGSQEPVTQLLAAYVQELGGAPKATVLGHGFKTSAPQAALVNGTSAHALDFDDRMHMSTHTLPAALAVGEEPGLTGRRLLASYVLGREIRAKLDAGIDAKRSIGIGPYARGWHSTGTTACLASAASAGKVMVLDVDAMRRAFAIATAGAGAVIRNFGTMTKPMHAGNSARPGVMAAALAARGFTGDPEVLEGPNGFVAALCLEGECDWHAMTETLGNPYELETKPISGKVYPSCTGTHRAIDGMLQLRREHGFTAADVERIECDLNPNALPRLDPRLGIDGRFSMGFCVAVALLEGDVAVRPFTDAMVVDPAVRQVMGKIVHVPLERVRGQHVPPERLAVRLRGGREVVAMVDKPRDLTTLEEIWAKYMANAQLAISADAAEELGNLILELEKVSDATRLVALASGRVLQPA